MTDQIMARTLGTGHYALRAKKRVFRVKMEFFRWFSEAISHDAGYSGAEGFSQALIPLDL
jgi:hypothetical protein